MTIDFLVFIFIRILFSIRKTLLYSIRKMMFRYGKIIESNSKTSRSDRFAEMSKQQQLIESKKQEIKAKFEERKRQEAEEALKKTSNKSTIENKTSKGSKGSISSRMQSWKKWRKKQNTETSETNSNLFSNDGSFLEKYKKITKTQSEEDQEGDKEYQNNSDNEISKSRDDRISVPGRSIGNDIKITPHPSYEPNRSTSHCDGIPYPPPSLLSSSSLTMTTQQQSLYSITSHPPPSTPPSSTIHTSLAAVPASVPLLTAVPSSRASLQTVSLIQVPVSVPASSVILSCPLETTLVTSEPVVHLPVVHSTLPPNSISVPLQTVPLQTAVIPAQIQITSQTAVPQSSVQTVQINQSSTNVILSQMTPQSILVPSECIQSNPLLSQPPPTHSVYSMTSSNYPPHELPPVHLPPPNFNPVALRQDMPVQPVSANCKISHSSEYDGYRDERTITSEAEYRSSRDRNRSQGLDRLEDVARMVVDYGDEMENVLLSKYPEDEKLWFLKDKMNPSYMAFRGIVDRMKKERGMKENSGNNGLERYHSKVPADDDDSDAEDVNDRQKRKRKRKSRWAPENVKVEIPPIIVPSNPPPPLNVPPPSLNTTLSVSPIPVPSILPPIQDRKLPGVSGPAISQINRSDPALIQYAMKSYGTVNLSEEDWKKAEDHYKINLLYQDMLKKRAELERLQAAGKHKYAYDSDEDTEGGTWEHKLRQQEMIATQRWAEELNEQAKGKHHIGDFLPPDELDRFMERYNAVKQGREPDLSDYKEFKLKEDNIGFQMLQKWGWSEGQGLGQDGSGMVNPVNKAANHLVSHGLGVEKPDEINRADDEFDAYRKRMMLAYRFRPNPLNNPRRPYY